MEPRLRLKSYLSKAGLELMIARSGQVLTHLAIRAPIGPRQLAPKCKITGPVLEKNMVPVLV